MFWKRKQEALPYNAAADLTYHETIAFIKTYTDISLTIMNKNWVSYWICPSLKMHLIF